MRPSVLAEGADVMKVRHLAGHQARAELAQVARTPGGLRRRAQVILGLTLQDGKAGVVVGELGQVRERDLAGPSRRASRR